MLRPISINICALQSDCVRSWFVQQAKVCVGIIHHFLSPLNRLSGQSALITSGLYSAVSAKPQLISDEFNVLDLLYSNNYIHPCCPAVQPSFTLGCRAIKFTSVTILKSTSVLKPNTLEFYLFLTENGAQRANVSENLKHF